MTPEVNEMVSQNTWLIIGGGIAVFSALMTLLSAMKLPVLKFVVLLGTFALAMAFAGNDLVNFVGVPLTGLEAWQDYIANGNGDAHDFMMQSLMESAHTPAPYLIAAGVVMVLALIFSKKAQNVVKTSVDLSRQDGGDEMFGSSGVARTLVRTSRSMASSLATAVPPCVSRWVDSRFNADAAVLKPGAAFDEIRAAVNLVTAAVHHLRHLHGGYGNIACRPCMGARECRVPHYGCAVCHRWLVHHGWRGLHLVFPCNCRPILRVICGNGGCHRIGHLPARSQ